MKVEFVGQSARDAGNVAASTGRLLNCYREATEGRYVLRSVPGLALFADMDRVFLRAMAEIEGVLYAVCGGGLFKITTAGVATLLGEVGDSVEATISGNYGKIVVTAADTYYIWDGATLSAVPVGDVEGGPDEWLIGSADYVGGYTVITEKGGRRIQWSDLADAETLPGLNFATAETTDEAILRGMSFGDNYVVMKQNSIEWWTVTGLANDQAFALIPGSIIETGLRSFALATKYPNGAAFVSSDGKVFAWTGEQLAPISTPQVEAALDLFEPVRCLYYEARGHGFICVTFRDAPAWCYDIATGEWHERAEGVTMSPWSAVVSAKLGNFWLVGSDSGKIGVCSADLRDFGGVLARQADSRMLEQPQRFIVPFLEIRGTVGVARVPAVAPATISEDGSVLEALAGVFIGDLGPDQGPPAIQVRFSRDGLTFGNERTRSFGAVGRYDTRMTFRALGQFRRMVMRVTMTAPVETTIFCDAELVAQ